MKTKTTFFTLVLMCIAWTASAQTMLEERLAAEVEPGTSAIFACQVGERIAIDARGIERVSTDDAKILKVSADDDHLFFTCEDLGTTQLVVHRKDKVASVVVRAGAAHDEDVDVRQCGDLRGIKARVVLGKSGRVHQVLISSAADAQSACLRESLSGRKWSSGEPFLRVARFEW